MFLNRDNCEVSRDEKIHFIIYITNSVYARPFRLG